ncbi:MAG: thiamine biosynthesis lipoprotein [Crocinitomicaceae bacterium]|jgi:thiamine biosynthesis lipoprotein
MEASRRNFLKCASAGSLGILLSQCNRSTEPEISSECGDAQWSGIGFGMEMSAEWYGVRSESVEMLNAMIERMIRGGESAFSLYSASSELSRLNSERKLENPSEVFTKLLGLSGALVDRTLGLFQPAIHGAWSSLDGAALPDDWAQRIQASSLDFVQVNENEIRLTNPLMQLSFNAIVQGVLADQVAQQARNLGVTSALLHLGESYAIGQHPEGRDWSLAVMGTPVADEIDLVGTIEFADAGLAVSAHDATRKLVNPLTGEVMQYDRVVAVASKEGAAVADAFATAFAVADESQWEKLYKSLTLSEGGLVKLWQKNKLTFERS